MTEESQSMCGRNQEGSRIENKNLDPTCFVNLITHPAVAYCLRKV